MPNSSDSGFTYRAFLSYSHHDRAWADWLHKSLETWRVPKRLVGTRTAHGVITRRLNPIFRDREELASAAELGRQINEALAQSENLIVICSPAAAASRWVNEEVRAFNRLGRAGRIFCLIVNGEPNASDVPGREAEECFCPALRFQTGADGQPTPQRIEPIAADARPGKDGKVNAKLKLIAGILGVGFDTLKQREQHRQVRRMATIAGSAVGVMIVTIALAVFALISRHSAVVAQYKAEIAQQTAVRRQKQAEDLVNFMLGDLTKRLRQLDKLGILRVVDDKAMAYFKSLPPTDVNATELAQRAEALQRIGEVRMGNSRLPDAMDAFQRALRLNRQLVAHAPNDPARQNAYAENLLWVGYTDWNEDKRSQAEAAFKQSANALERATALAPSNNDIAHNLDNVYNNLGHVAQARGQMDLAQREYLSDQALCRRMATAHPDDVLWRSALGDAYDNLATLALLRGQLPEALTGYVKEQQLVAALVAAQPQNRQMQAQLLRDDDILGRTFALAGETRAGLGYINAALAIGKSLMAFDPHHNDWRSRYAYSGTLASRLLLDADNPAAAVPIMATSLASSRKLVTFDPSDSEWRTRLAQAQLQAARLAQVRHQLRAARKLALQAVATMQKLLAADSPGATSIRIQAKLELLLGKLAAATGDATMAGQYRQRAQTRLRPLTQHSDDPRNLALWVDALLATGSRVQAQSAIQKLRHMGYRSPAFIARLHGAGVDYPKDPKTSKRIVAITASATAGRHAGTSGTRPASNPPTSHRRMQP